MLTDAMSETSPVHIGERELRTVMLRAFKPAVREGKAVGVMAAYHEIDGIPVTADSFPLKDVLRNEWNFPVLCSQIWVQSGACMTFITSPLHPRPRLHGCSFRRGHRECGGACIET